MRDVAGLPCAVRRRRIVSVTDPVTSIVSGMRRSLVLSIVAVALALGAAVPGAQQAPAPPFDVVIAGGRLVDGTGAPWFLADVGIRGDRIAAIGQLANAPAAARIDARGFVVAPGFIDPHVHARERLFDLPNAEGYLLQGLTTVVDGNDGSSPLPVAAWFDKVAAAGVSPNVALFVGHGTVREAVMGTANRKATPAELAKMRELVAEAMRQGALGLSTGLAYVPGTYAPTDEIVALAETAREHGGIYISHMRDEGGGVLDSVRETIAIGERAKIPVQISHHKVGGRQQFGQSVQSLSLIAAARQRGVDVTFDQYPYTASHTGLSLIFPRWALADDKLNERLASAGQRKEIKTGMLAFIDERFGDDPSRIQLARCGHDPSLAGKTIADLLKAAGQPLTQSATADMVIELQLKGGCSAIFHSYDEPDVERFLQSPFGMIGSDGSLTRPGDGSPHPRAYGTYPRVLGRYVRERKILTLEDAVRKMTSFPAARLGLADRGVIRAGLAADITVFDPAAIADLSTYSDPHHYSVGVRHVLVNGLVTVKDGAHTGVRAGRVLRGVAAR
jgi:dihydroorotase/N-acyl-D-amino-acid deacylase